MDHVPYAVLDKWWMKLIEDGRFRCTQDAMPIFPLGATASTPDNRFIVTIQWRSNGLPHTMETRAETMEMAMITMWRHWIAEGPKL